MRRIDAIDPRSQGESTKTDGDNTPEARARDLNQVIQQLQLKNVVLVGWSQGVQDVAAYVEQFGTDSVAGFVLVDTPFSAGSTGIKLHPEFSERLFELMAVYKLSVRRANLGSNRHQHRVYDDAGDVIETHEHTGDLKEW